MGKVYSLAAEVRKANSPVAAFMRQRFAYQSAVQAEFRDQVATLPTLR